MAVCAGLDEWYTPAQRAEDQ